MWLTSASSPSGVELQVGAGGQGCPTAERLGFLTERTLTIGWHQRGWHLEHGNKEVMKNPHTHALLSFGITGGTVVAKESFTGQSWLGLREVRRVLPPIPRRAGILRSLSTSSEESRRLVAAAQDRHRLRPCRSLEESRPTRLRL
jgi:hypothetical protein